MNGAAQNLREADSGASAVEYGLLIAAVAAIIVLLVFAVGALTKGLFKDTCDGIKNDAPASISSQATC